jgi:alkyl sulfatase BDS1-like metallo-beta-lactamase superfamily hydrolase
MRPITRRAPTAVEFAALALFALACGSGQGDSPTQSAHEAGPAAEGGHATRQLSSFGLGQTEPYKVADNVFQHHAVGNTSMVVTSEGNVIIDTGLPPRALRDGDISPRELLAMASDGPTRAVVVTHAHQDHLGGTSEWVEEGTEIIAHETYLETQRYLTELVPFFMARNQPLYPNEVPDVPMNIAGGLLRRFYPQVQPTIEVDDVYEFELGGTQFEVIHTPGAEGEDSICVWLPQQKILFTGDFFGPLFPMFPNLYTIRGEKFRWPIPYIDSLNKVLALEPEIIVPSHFEPIVGKEKIREGVTRTRDATQYVHDETVKGMNAGKDVYTLMREIELPRHLDLSEGHGKVSWSVRGIWEAYSGFFKYRSTTELYDVPRHYLDAEVVDLIGGPDSVVEQADVHLAAGRPLEALHYTDMALTAEDDHEGALETRIAALELLMERSGDENHSEVLWLTHRIGATREALGL